MRGPGPASPGPLLTVVVPVYQVEAYVAETLDSILASTYRNLEVLCVDDGSTDGGPAVVEEYAARDPRVRLVHQENQGLSAARNTGMALAQGTYVTLLDSDDLITPDVYRAAVESLEQSGSDFCVYATVRLKKDGTLGEPTGGFPAFGAQATDVARFPEVARLGTATNKVMRREFLERHGLRFEPGILYEDIPFTMTLAVKAHAFDTLPMVGVHWRIRPESGSITQKLPNPANAVARARSMRQSLEILEGVGMTEAHVVRSSAIARSLVPTSMLRAARKKQAYWDVLSDSFQKLLPHVAPSAWQTCAPWKRMVAAQLLVGDREGFLRYLVPGASPHDHLPTTVHHGVVRLDVRVPRSEGLPPELLDFSLRPVELEPRRSLRDVESHADGTATLTFWGYYPNVDLAANDTQLTLVVVDDVNGARHELPTIRVSVDERTEDVGQPHDYCDYGPSLVTARLRPTDLPTDHAAHLEVTIRTAGLVSIGPFLTRRSSEIKRGVVGRRTLRWGAQGLAVSGSLGGTWADRAARQARRAARRAARVVRPAR